MAKFLMIGGSLDGQILEKTYPREVIHKLNNNIKLGPVSEAAQIVEISTIETYWVHHAYFEGKLYAYASLKPYNPIKSMR
ncbi:hypothetical protein GTU79_01585 [Sodalis ligni]|uniref:hypothetical protein n=1 Tax=Sodalis ligni TaxID=2697027 RepID=UPI001BDF0077|nr:hypothetical protein [Sodalis ligni]QWA11539.1 hypothetical protein GTU79_01585 [Sodalis ligni]